MELDEDQEGVRESKRFNKSKEGYKKQERVKDETGRKTAEMNGGEERININEGWQYHKDEIYSKMTVNAG